MSAEPEAHDARLFHQVETARDEKECRSEVAFRVLDHLRPSLVVFARLVYASIATNGQKP